MIPIGMLLFLYLGLPAAVILLIIGAVLRLKGRDSAPVFFVASALCVVVTVFLWVEISQVNFGL